MTTGTEYPHFVDAQERHREHPDTFDVPGLAEIGQVRPGDHVKVGVELPSADGEQPQGERFWVTVELVDHMKQRIRARVDNQLLLAAELGLDLGSPIELEFRHVVDLMHQEAERGQP